MFLAQRGINMTQYNKTTLKTFFQTGDIPDGNDYANFIDSYVNQVETGDQPIAGSISPTELSTARVSAGNINATGTLTIAGITSVQDIYASTVRASTLAITGAFSAASLSTDGNLTVGGDITASGRVTAGSMTITANISAASLNVTGDVLAQTGMVFGSAARIGNGLYRAPVVVSAAGSTQATASPLGNSGTIRLKGIADGVTTGFLLPANQTGNQQTVYVEENTSCNLWPCVGGQINALASNAAFPMAGNTTYIITHIKASGYAVK